MKKFLSFGLMFVFALTLFVTYKPTIYAADSTSKAFTLYETNYYNIEGYLKYSINNIPDDVYVLPYYIGYTGNVTFPNRYGYVFMSKRSDFRNDISGTVFNSRNGATSNIIFNSVMFTKSGLSVTQETEYDGVYFYSLNVDSKEDLHQKSGISGHIEYSYPYSESFLNVIEQVKNGTYVDPDSVGGINNPDSNPAIGNLVDLQNTYITYDKTFSELFNSEIPTTSYINFNWGNETNNGYKLTDYSLQYFATGTILKDNGANGVLEIPVRYSDGNKNFNLSFNNKWDFVVDWSDILDSAGISYTTNISNVSSSRPLAQSYYTNGLKFSFRPVLKINGKYYAGQWTQVTIVNNGVNGSIFTENVIIDTDGTRPSNNQNGTGVNNNPNGVKNPYDDFINGSTSDYDFSGFIDTTNSILDQIRGIPRIFGLIFSWLPSWVLDMFSMMIGFFILAMLVSIVIKVVT